MKRDNSPAGRRYARDRAVATGRMLEAKPGETMRVGHGSAEVLKPGQGPAERAGWRVQPVCIDGSPEFNGWQAYRHGMSDEAEPELSGLFATEAEAWADACAIEGIAI